MLNLQYAHCSLEPKYDQPILYMFMLLLRFWSPKHVFTDLILVRTLLFLLSSSSLHVTDFNKTLSLVILLKHFAVTFQCEHENLLCHPLVGNFIFQKFWLMTFPVLLLNMLLYCAILVGLNIFALIVPRPGPDSETCEIQAANYVWFYC